MAGLLVTCGGGPCQVQTGGQVYGFYVTWDAGLSVVLQRWWPPQDPILMVNPGLGLQFQSLVSL